MSIPTINAEIDLLIADGTAIEADARAEQCAQVMDRLAFLKQRIKEAEEAIRPVLIRWIEETGRSIGMGDGSYWYAGYAKETNCIDVAATLERVFVLSEGDFAKAALFLGSSPFKYGAIRQAIGDAGQFDKLFETTEKTSLKRGGGPVEKQLIKADPRFAR